MSPSHGPTSGGTSVTITGTHLTGATAVHFGTSSATTFTVVSDTQITATAPASTSLGTVHVTVTTPGGTSATGSGDQYTYVATIAQIQGAGRIPVGSHAGEFSVAAQRTSATGSVSGHLEFEDQPDGVHIHDGTFTDLYVTADGTAHAQGTASCTISGTTSSCSFSLTATNGGKGTGTFTLTYNTTTVGGTILSGHVTVSPTTGGPTTAATPAAAATIGTFSTTLLGVSLSGGQCAAAAEVTSSGSSGGEVDCLLLGALGVDIEVDLPTTTGSTGTGTATLGGTATVTVGSLLPLSLPATANLVSTGSTPGLQLTINGVTLPVLPIGAGGIEIG
ncbi:IPT/TIG domain-containing protein [Catenulispora yoronensis]